MVWNEQEHPRDEEGKFTFKNNIGVVKGKSKHAQILYKDSIKQKEITSLQQKRKNELLNLLKDKATAADVLYADNEKLEKKIKELGLDKETEGAITGGAVEVDREFIVPVKGVVRSEFGYRERPTEKASTNHSGIDIRVPIGTPVQVITDGTVIKASNNSKGYGTAVFVDHGIINGKRVVSEYGHLSKFNVKVGDKVKQGQVIAKSGNSGVTTGPHLHITIKENAVPVNPRKYLKGL